MSRHNTTILKLVKLAHTAPSADNSQPWKLTWDGSFLCIGYDSHRVEGKTFPAESSATLLSMGSVIEIIVKAATDWELKHELLISDTLPDSQGIYARIRLDTREMNDGTEKSDKPITLRHTNRLSFSNRHIPAHLSHELEALRQNEARVSVFSTPNKIKEIGHLIRAASEVRFQTEEVHRWLDRSLRFSTKSAAHGDGMDVSTLGLPPGGALFLYLIRKWNRMRWLNKIGVYKVVARIDAAPIYRAPAILAINAPAGSPKSTLDAGRLMTRAWINLNSKGLSVHPYYVVSDQLDRLRDNSVPSRLRPKAKELEAKYSEVGDLQKGETVHMLLRFGYQQHTPRLSQRIPLETVYTDLSC